MRIYEQLNVDELEKLKKSLDIIRVERSEQVIQFQARFRELKGSAKTIIKRIKQHDMDYERLVSGFFNAIEQVDCLHGGISLDDFSKIEKKDRFKLKRIDRRI